MVGAYRRLAQPPADDQNAAERIAELDQVVVVGSRFAGNSEAGMVPVEVMDQEEIDDQHDRDRTQQSRPHPKRRVEAGKVG